MIKYALGCSEGHSFESWFPDSAAYEQQRERGLVACPECGSARVEKAIMAPAVMGAERISGQGSAATLDDGRRHHSHHMLARIRREIEANTDDVGAKFPEVARAIHVGDEPRRGIRGRASLGEAKALIEEGVEVMPMPMLEDELN